ncbi:MAG: M28 family peptidase [Bacteroidales bacterium]
MTYFFNGLIFTFICLIPIGGCRAQNSASITSGELRKHVEYLASQELAGRYPGTPGDLAAATYIRNCFKEYGLTQLPENGFQQFQVTTGIKKGAANIFSINGQSAVADKDFTPISISDNGKVNAPIVFLGYGFRIKSDTLNWDDYAGNDVRGKIGLILLGAPEPPKGSATDPFEDYGSIRSKLLNARDAGVAAVIFVAGPAYDDKDELEFGTVKESSAGLPVIRAKRAFMNQALSGMNMKVEVVEMQLNQSHQSLSKDLGLTASVQTDIITQTATTQNVVGWIQARDTGARQEWIVVGAHFDHLGMGGMGSNSRVQDTIGVHPGADDNASGVASVIEMAGYLSSIKDKLNRSVLFVAFTGEEMGLLGSKYFVAHSPVPLKRISAMVNMDMVGRPNEEKRLSISGSGTALEMDSLLGLIKPEKLAWAKSPEGFGPSDHASFYTVGIPVLYFSTGAHLDYHTPGDTPGKLDYSNMTDIADQVSEIILSIADAPKVLTFKEAGPKVSDSGRRKLKVTLGIMPDVSGTENNGLRVEFATPGKPAQLAGITKGDRIVGINGLPVTNVYDYMTRLQSLKSGQTVSVELLRGDKKIIVLVQL